MKIQVGEFLADELSARGWTQAAFAEILGRPAQFVNEVIAGKKELTRESALQIASALETSPELWLRLQDDFRLQQAKDDPRVRTRLNEIRRRARNVAVFDPQRRPADKESA